jgi:hypothetical protein
VREIYPDLRLTVEQQIAEGEWVATRVTARGTHRGGVWLGMKPTGKSVEITAVNIDRVVDGRIVEHGGAANLLEPMLAIGCDSSGRTNGVIVPPTPAPPRASRACRLTSNALKCL